MSANIGLSGRRPGGSLFAAAITRLSVAFVLSSVCALQPGRSIAEVNPDRLLRHVQATARTLDWKEILNGGEKIVYVGELHSIPEMREELANQMTTFREAGVTHLAFEAFREVRQPLLDSYFQAGSAEQVQKLEVDLLEAIRLDWIWMPESYLGLVRAARRSGIKLLALEDYSPMFPQPARNCAIGRSFCRGRDCRMAMRLDRALREDPGAKILVLVGRNHVRADELPEHLRRLYGRESKSVAFLEGTTLLDGVLWKAGLESRRVFIPKPDGRATFDGFVSVPEIAAAGRRSLSKNLAIEEPDPVRDWAEILDYGR